MDIAFGGAFTDATLLSRVQFAVTIGFHILFPTLTIGLSLFLVSCEALWLRTGNIIYYQLYRFWVKVFAVSFGMGVVSGVVLSYQFGTNFSRFSEAVGNVIGPLLGYEVMTAFFLEASFLGVMLFGWRRVGNRLHFASTCIVAAGTFLSAFWILAAGSWMHTPAGYRLEDGIFFVESWWAVIFNPSFPYRLAHMLLASCLTTALFVAGVSAWHLLKGKAPATARPAFSMAMWAVLALALLQVIAGDLHGLQVHRDQPIKVAAMEAIWETQRGAPFTLFAWPDTGAGRNRLAVEIPYAASLILTHDPMGEVQGLKSVPGADRPPVPIVFFAFRVMLILGFSFVGLGLLGLLQRWRRRLTEERWFLRLCVLFSPMGFGATLAGWITTETGRQPWVVQGLMRTAEAASPVEAKAVFTSLSLFVAVYGLLFAAYLYYLGKHLKAGPDDEAMPRDQAPARTAWMRE